MTPNIVPWSVIATAGISISLTRCTSFLMLLKPSRSENSVWTCRWAKDMARMRVAGVKRIIAPGIQDRTNDFLKLLDEDGIGQPVHPRSRPRLTARPANPCHADNHVCRSASSAPRSLMPNPECYNPRSEGLNMLQKFVKTVGGNPHRRQLEQL